MARIQNALIFALLCILAGTITQASNAEHRPPHIHHDHEVPLDSSSAEHRPPHFHHDHEVPLDSSSAEHRPPHIHHDHEVPLDSSGAGHRPSHNHDEAPLEPSDAKGRPPHIHGPSPFLPPGILGRPPHHINEEAPLDPTGAEHRPSHIHDNDKPFQHNIPDLIPITSGIHWTPCDFHAGPRARCHDLNMLLICTRLGGFVLDCPDASVCKNGLCSNVVPSA